jgi:hypothetical protein
VRGVLAGHPRHLDDQRRAHALAEADPGVGLEALADEAAAGGESLQGMVRPGRLGALLELLPEACPVRVGGTGQFEVSGLAPAQTDALLARCAERSIPAEVRDAAVERRGLATALDPGARRLAADLKRALDPEDILQ